LYHVGFLAMYESRKGGVLFGMAFLLFGL